MSETTLATIIKSDLMMLVSVVHDITQECAAKPGNKKIIRKLEKVERRLFEILNKIPGDGVYTTT